MIPNRQALRRAFYTHYVVAASELRPLEGSFMLTIAVFAGLCLD